MKKYLLSALFLLGISGITMAATPKKHFAKKHYNHHVHHGHHPAKHHHHHHPHHK